MMSRLLGEDDVVPVLAGVPRKTFRSRNRRGADEDGPDDSVRRMVGEADEKEEVIPKDAEPVDPSEMTVGKPLRPTKDVVQEPSHPQADKEKYLTPYSALTAPDVTPQSTQPIDPSQVPGATGPEKFTAADLERAQPSQSPVGDVAAKAMDVLLGKNRPSKPAAEQGQGELERFQNAGTAVTEEQAAAMMGVSPVAEEAAAKAANLLVAAKDGGSAMPDPAPIGDGSKIMSAFRRFNG